MWIIYRQELFRARARAVSPSLSAFFPPRIPNLPEQPQIFALPYGIYRHLSHLGGKDWEAVGPRWGDGRIGLGPDPRPSPLAKAGGVCLRLGLPPLRRAAAGPAGCWREEGRSRAPRLARPRGRWQALGSVASARDRLDFALVCFIGSNRKIKKKKFLIYYQSNKALNRFPGCSRTQTGAPCAAPTGFFCYTTRSRSASQGVASAGENQGSDFPARTPLACPPGSPELEYRLRGKGSGWCGSRVQAAPPLGANAGGELGLGEQIFILMIFTCTPSFPTVAFPGQPLLGFRSQQIKITRCSPAGCRAELLA